MRTILSGVFLATLFATTSLQAAEFTAPAGQLGAGLGNGPESKARAYIDGTAYFRTGTRSSFGSDIKWTELALPVLLGGGYKLMPNLELEGRLALAAAHIKVKNKDCPDGADCEDSAGSLTPANLYFGANYMFEMNEWLVKVGGGIAYGPWTHDPNSDRFWTYLLSFPTRLEDFYVYAYDTFSIVAPARVEYRFLPELAFTADVSLATLIPTSGNGDVELASVIAPGAGYLMGDLILGGRLPLFWALTEDTAQFALEPFARYDFEQFFLTGRFTLYLDDPYGFSFDEGEPWGLHVGFGGTF
jgi:hypothetical protein